MAAGSAEVVVPGVGESVVVVAVGLDSGAVLGSAGRRLRLPGPAVVDVPVAASWHSGLVVHFVPAVGSSVRVGLGYYSPLELELLVVALPSAEP